MRSISAHVEHGESRFAVRYSDYLTLFGGTVKNAVHLHAAVAAVPGATMSKPTLVKCWSDTGLREDEQWEWQCLLEPSAANVAALIATDFDWEESAIELASRICPADAIRRIRRDQAERSRKARELLERAKERLAATRAAERPGRKWWQFWKA
jgi:hypothetical protein